MRGMVVPDIMIISKERELVEDSKGMSYYVAIMSKSFNL